MEEEFLLVTPDGGYPAAQNEAVARHAMAGGVELQLELTSCQVETATDVAHTSDELRQELARLRRGAADAAAAVGAQLLAVGLPPTEPSEYPITDNPRYRRIADRFGMIAREQGICGCHVHVQVPDRRAAIEVSNRLRPWLPTLLALTANSAIYRNSDTGYASWRSVLWGRWPSAGPPPHFDSVEDYDSTVAMMEDTGAMLDDGMVYWDVRPSANFPTVEVRVSDVPATVAETVLYATIVRALVMTSLAAGANSEQIPNFTEHALRAAYWRSARDGVRGTAIDLEGGRGSAPIHERLATLIGHIRPALEHLGDYAMVTDEVQRITTEGNGAVRQRRAWQRRGAVMDVIAYAAAATLE